MNRRQRKFLAWSAAALIALIGVVVLLAGLMIPVRVDLSDSRRPPSASGTRASTGPNADPSHFDLVELLPLCDRDLRRPLNADPAAGAGSPSGTPLTLQLVGTANEPGHSMAILKKGDGTVVLGALGDTIDGAGGPSVITRIAPDRISVKYAGSVRELVLPPATTGLEGGGP